MNSVAFILGSVTAKLFDPVSFIVVLIVNLFSRKKWIIVVAAIIGAIVTETVITFMQLNRTWGHGLIIGFVASLLHSLLLYWVVGRFNKKTPKEDSID